MRRERVLPAAPLRVTLPIVLIVLLKFSEFGVHLQGAGWIEHLVPPLLPMSGRNLTGAPASD